jgi:hypothetical protein
MRARARPIALGVLAGVIGGVIEVWAVWRFLGLDSDTKTFAATAVGFFGLVAGVAIVVFWSVSSFPADLKRPGITAGVAGVCAGTLALLWAANAAQTLQMTAAVGAILAGLLTRQLRRRLFKRQADR